MDRISCLIIESDQETVRHIDVLGRKIGTIDIRWKTNSVETGIGIIRKHLPEMAIIGLGGDPSSMIGSISRVAMEFPFLYIMALSAQSDSDLILRAMRSGAHDFLIQPVTENDLRAAAEKVFKLKSSKEAPRRSGGRIVSVFSSKGGHGTTTIAVNLADALSKNHGKKVAVVDLVLAHGDVATFFNINPNYSILDLARNAQKADYDFLHTLMVKHSSGVYILADPPTIEDSEQISAVQVREVLLTLCSMFDYIVVDTPHHFDERTLTALEMSDTILVVSLLNLPSLKNTQKCLELFGRIGLRDERIRLVLSRYLPSDDISRETIEGILACPVFISVPNDYPVVISSVNRGKLLREIWPQKEVTKSFGEMAALLVRPQGKPTEPKPKKRGLFQKIFQPERRKN
jgi:pilus assembly protein CpaE